MIEKYTDFIIDLMMQGNLNWFLATLYKALKLKLGLKKFHEIFDDEDFLYFIDNCNSLDISIVKQKIENIFQLFSEQEIEQLCTPEAIQKLGPGYWMKTEEEQRFLESKQLPEEEEEAVSLKTVSDEEVELIMYIYSTCLTELKKSLGDKAIFAAGKLEDKIKQICSDNKHVDVEKLKLDLDNEVKNIKGDYIKPTKNKRKFNLKKYRR